MFLRKITFITGPVIFFIFLFEPAKGFSTVLLMCTGTREDTVTNKNYIAKPRIYTTTRLSVARSEIDVKLNDACWTLGTWTGNFTEWIPNEGAKPPQPTKFKILYDDKNIYVAIRAYDTEPDRIQKFARLRDEFSGDAVGITFDSYNDQVSNLI
jgi:hypothetical protein